jgi:hypothetical protein
MDVYLYSLVRCRPDPSTGEFVNIGAIAGSPVTGDWSMRQVGDESRVRRIADTTALEVAHSFLARVGRQIDENVDLMEDVGQSGLDEPWFQRLYRDHQDVVQLTSPTPILAEDAEQALETLFDRVVIDPSSRHGEHSISRHRVLGDLRDAYHRAGISSHHVRPKAQVYVGGHVHTPVDFAIGQDRVVQLAQGWSFQRDDVEDLSLQVKAWGYVIEELRCGENARVVDADDRQASIPSDVDLEVAFAQPRTREQAEAFEEASEVFSHLGGHLSELNEVDSVAERAAERLHVRR